MKTSKALRLFLFTVLLISALSISVVSAQTDPVTIRIGYQRGDHFSLNQAKGWFEAALGEGYTVEYTLFPAGPQLLEALNAGSIDIGGTGAPPPVFAQAADVPLVYIASSIANGGESLIVPTDSPVQTVADLKGKKVAFTQGSSANYLFVQALAYAGLEYGDIEPVFLSPSDAGAAFQAGSVDGWIIWDPFLTIAQVQTGAREILRTDDLGVKRVYYEASRTFAETQPDALIKIIEQLQTTVDWIRENPDEYSVFLEENTTVPADVWKAIYEQSGVSDIEYLNQEIVASQQEIADAFFELQLIPKAITIADAVWTPTGTIDPAPVAEESTPEATPGA